MLHLNVIFPYICVPLRNVLLSTGQEYVIGNLNLVNRFPRNALICTTWSAYLLVLVEHSGYNVKEILVLYDFGAYE